MHNFDKKDSGCKATLDRKSQPLDCFQIFFPESSVNVIVKKTSEYQNSLQRKRPCNVNSRMKLWNDTNIDEKYCFLGTVLLMSRVKKLSYKEYWLKDKLIRTDIFNSIMTQDRFLNVPASV